MGVIRSALTPVALVCVAVALITATVACAQDARAEEPPDEVVEDEQTDDRRILAESFDGSLENWDTSMVATATSNGALVFSARQDQSLILREPLPMDNIIVEFRARAETNGIQVYLMKTQNEHYGWALGMGGNEHSMLIDGASGQALETVIGEAYTPGEWHTWRLVRRGASLEARRDGELIISSDAARLHSGQGLLVFSSDNASVALDDLRIYHAGPADDTQAADTDSGDADRSDAQEDADGPYEPMALDPDSSVKQAIICLGFDDRSALRGVQDRFPSGTEKVALYMEIEGASPNSEIQMTWQRDGRIIGRQLLLVSGDRKNLAYLYATGRDTLWDGHYAVDLKENDRLVGRVTFRVGGE
ncbi:MAG: family 16 glycoside hydrolase [Armatimonadota bacterium]